MFKKSAPSTVPLSRSEVSANCPMRYLPAPCFDVLYGLCIVLAGVGV